MGTIRDMKKVLSDERLLNMEDSQKLSEFLKQMEKEGLLLKKEYDLPPIDTIGSEAYQTLKTEFSSP